VLVYRGTEDETFCSAVAEAQAAGVPAVVCNIGSMSERVDDRATGYVVSAETGRDEQEFSAATIKLLKEDNVWSRMNRLAIAQQRSRGWEQAAVEFEALLPGRRKI
jgi:glycosyltransferase involved in cell wall biosynthesis